MANGTATVPLELSNSNTFEVWPKFVEAIRYLMERRSNQSNRNYIYISFSVFNEQINEFILSSRFIEELDSGLKSNESKPHSDLIFIEMNSFIKMVDTLKEEIKRKLPYGYLKDGLGIGKTIIDSIKDLAGLSKYGKMGLQIYGEAIDISKGFLSSRGEEV